jgi:hypothetical protein
VTDRGKEYGPAQFGPYFCLEPSDPRHRPWVELSSVAAWSDVLPQARAVIGAGAVGDRVVASIVFLGLAARVLSPALGAAVLGTDVAPVCELAWRVDTGRFLFAGRPASLAATLTSLSDLAGAVAGHFQVAPRILAGNVSSALVGGARVVSSTRPDLADAVAGIVAEPFADGRLPGALSAGPTLHRDSCCLFYRVPGAGYCGDCVLAE